MMPIFRNPFTESQIHTLNRDGRYWNGDHPESESYRRIVTRAYENAYPEDAERDITGRSRAKAKRAFEALGLLDARGSRIRDVTSAIRGFQHMFELEPDGLMNPGGETVKTLRDTFGPREKPPARVPPYRPGGDGGKFTVLTGYLGKSGAGGGDDGGMRGPESAMPPKPEREPAPPGRRREPWPETPISKAYLDKMHMKESQELNYKEFNPDGPAWGRYQMTPSGLIDTSMMDDKGNWIGRYGIHSADDFLWNPMVQEKVMAEYTQNNQRYLRDKGVIKHIGQEIDGIKARIIVTESGLLAAAHRQGAGTVNRYLKYQEINRWRGNARTITDEDTREKFLSVETRLREFQDVPHQRSSAKSFI